MSGENQVAVRLLGTTISLRFTDTRLKTIAWNEENYTYCRACVCRSCGRLRRPEPSPEEVANLFRKAA